MTSLFFDANGGRSIALDSAEKRPIDNYQGGTIAAHLRNQFPDFELRYGKGITRRAEPSPRYNCHGLSFAARRTCIESSDAVRQILREDGYKEMSRELAEPGDFVLYFSDDGDVEHSGLLLEAPSKSALGLPLVLSKWGMYAEVVHRASHCPYSVANLRFYRVVSI